MKKLFLFIIIFSLSVHAIGVSPGKYVVNDPVEGEEFSFKFHFSRSDGGSITYEKEYHGMPSLGTPGYTEEKSFFDSIILPGPTSGSNWQATSNTVVITGVWPEFKVPGEREIYIVGVEVSDSSPGQVSAVAAVASRIIINIPYDGLYVDLSSNIDNVLPGEIVNMVYDLEMIGTEGMGESRIDVDVYNLDDILLESLSLQIPPISSSEVYTSNIDLGEYDPGHYRADLTLSYNNDEWVLSDTFIVADNTLTVDCKNLTSGLAVHPANFQIMSGYLDEQEVNLEFIVDNDVLGEESFVVSPLGSTNAKLFLDFTNSLVGEYEYILKLNSNEVCRDTLFLLSADKAQVPIYVYYVGFGSVLVVIVLSLLYYFYIGGSRKRDDDSIDF